MITYDCMKIIAQMPQSSVFNGTEMECKQRRTVYFRPADTRIILVSSTNHCNNTIIVTVICCKMLCIKFQQYVLNYEILQTLFDVKNSSAFHGTEISLSP